MKTFTEPTADEIKLICQRPEISVEQILSTIKSIFNEVKLNGDSALKKYTHYFDKVDLDVFCLSQKEIDDSKTKVSSELKTAIQMAKNNIEKFHLAQLTADFQIETSDGVVCGQIKRAIDKVGIYIPGGTAPLFSTVLMLAIPAALAKCKEIILCTPPQKDGTINPAILFAASICGVDKIYRVGGAQAIAALALGTETIPKVDKIFGPGNQYVTTAKTFAQKSGIAIDMPAGPSELMVVADETSVPAFVASDLLSQAEHGTDSQVVCMVNSQSLLSKISKEIEIQLQELPRMAVAKKALENSSFILVTDDKKKVEIINEYAPEHLILAVKTPRLLLPKINNAGSIFIGNYTPESAGDYASGTNHTLPTSGFARAYSGVNMDAFVKKITVQEISKQGIKELGPSIEIMAAAEGLQAHKNAISIRLQSIEK